MNRKIITAIAFFAVLTIGAVIYITSNGLTQPEETTPEPFDAARAYQDVLNQVDFGPRIPGSQAHKQTINYIQSVLMENEWKTDLQSLTFQNQNIQNIIAKRGSGEPLIILGAHYDSRIVADRDKNIDLQKEPVPGANDGASGVAVLLELSRILPREIQGQIWFVFFDAEDQGNLPGWEWILGSRAFVDQLDEKPDSVIIIDMIGDKNLDIYLEKNSDRVLSSEIWEAAKKLSYDQYFISEEKFAILDDHIPFIDRGIRAIDIIDFDYPYWHTGEDTADKVSPDSLKIIGDTLLEWLESKLIVGKN